MQIKKTPMPAMAGPKMPGMPKAPQPKAHIDRGNRNVKNPMGHAGKLRGC